jgi:hypothetical protein
MLTPGAPNHLAGTMPQTPSLKNFRRIVAETVTQMGTRRQ